MAAGRQGPSKWADEVEAEESLRGGLSRVSSESHHSNQMSIPYDSSHGGLRSHAQDQRQQDHGYDSRGSSRPSYEDPAWRTSRQEDYEWRERDRRRDVAFTPHSQWRDRDYPQPQRQTPQHADAREDGRRWQDYSDHPPPPHRTHPPQHMDTHSPPESKGPTKLLTRDNKTHPTHASQPVLPASAARVPSSRCELSDECMEKLQSMLKETSLEYAKHYYNQMYELLNEWLNNLADRVQQAVASSLADQLAKQQSAVIASVTPVVAHQLAAAVQPLLTPLQSQVQQLQQAVTLLNLQSITAAVHQPPAPLLPPMSAPPGMSPPQLPPLPSMPNVVQQGGMSGPPPPPPPPPPPQPKMENSIKEFFERHSKSRQQQNHRHPKTPSAPISPPEVPLAVMAALAPARMPDTASSIGGDSFYDEDGISGGKPRKVKAGHQTYVAPSRRSGRDGPDGDAHQGSPGGEY